METSFRPMPDLAGWRGTRPVRALWRPAHLPGVELVRATEVLTAIPRQHHEEIQLVVLEQGLRRFSFRDSSPIAAADSVIIIPSGEIHGSSPVDIVPVTASLLLISPTVLSATVAEIQGKISHPLSLSRAILPDPTLAHHVLRRHRALTESQTRLEQQTLLRDLLYPFLKGYSGSTEVQKAGKMGEKVVARLRSFIEERFAEEISLETLAEMADLSPFHLSRTFRQATGVPPHAYQIQVRVHRARHLLTAGMAGGEAAHETGFASQSHLITHFKRLIGMTPGEYARLSKNSKNVVDSSLASQPQSGHGSRL